MRALSRRQFVAGLVGLGAVTLGGLAGCTSDEDSIGGSEGSVDGIGDPVVIPKAYWAWVAKEVNGKTRWGCINERGEYVVEPRITEGEQVDVPAEYVGQETAARYISDFQANGLARVSYPNPNSDYRTLDGMINTLCEFVVAQKYDRIHDYAPNGLALATEVESPSYWKLSGYIDANGDTRIESKYDFAESFTKNGSAKVRVPETYLYGFLDENGEWLVEPQCEGAESFHQQAYPQIAGNWWALARQGDWLGYLDGDGNRAVTFESRITGVSDVFHMDKNSQSFGRTLSASYPDEETGLVVVSCNPGNDDDIHVSTFGQFGYAGPDGKLVIEPRWESAFPFFEGLAIVSTNLWHKQGVIDITGSYILEPSLYYIDRYHDGLALAQVVKDGTFGFLDAYGSWAIEPLYRRLGLFEHDGYAIASGLPTSSGIGDMGTGLLDRNGEFRCPPVHHTLSRSNSKGYRFARIYETPAILIDCDGNEVSDGGYVSYSGWADNGLCAVAVGDPFDPLWGFINESGEMVIEPQFKHAKTFFEAPS
jgi:putative transposon-encoded protein